MSHRACSHWTRASSTDGSSSGRRRSASASAPADPGGSPTAQALRPNRVQQRATPIGLASASVRSNAAWAKATARCARPPIRRRQLPCPAAQRGPSRPPRRQRPAVKGTEHPFELSQRLIEGIDGHGIVGRHQRRAQCRLPVAGVPPMPGQLRDQSAVRVGLHVEDAGKAPVQPAPLPREQRVVQRLAHEVVTEPVAGVIEDEHSLSRCLTQGFSSSMLSRSTTSANSQCSMASPNTDAAPTLGVPRARPAPPRP